MSWTRSTGWRRRRLIPVPLHEDPGLQPERTTMSWGRTVLALGVAAMFFFRWYPEHGPSVFLLVVIAAMGGLFIQLSQRRRYQAQVMGITHEKISPAVSGVIGLATLVVLLAIIGVLAMWLT